MSVSLSVSLLLLSLDSLLPNEELEDKSMWRMSIMRIKKQRMVVPSTLIGDQNPSRQEDVPFLWVVLPFKLLHQPGLFLQLVQ